MKNCHLDDKDCSVISQQIMKPSNSPDVLYYLSSIILDFNDIGNEGFLALLNAVVNEENQIQIMHLSLAYNKVDDIGFAQLVTTIAQGIKTNSRNEVLSPLKKIDLTANRVTSKSIELLYSTTIICSKQQDKLNVTKNANVASTSEKPDCNPETTLVSQLGEINIVLRHNISSFEVEKVRQEFFVPNVTLL
ncbi:hypothetical protein RFI_29411 [Reticulomyxa filosa]|uniref:Uncharacterized protein n=1 Tax=Reticulomyxa filosa TaxID=46433 RepID=X6M3D5_RETFI|nr:hypothetical protein RFI_29411 [Reticulomyxa filosa]|eukprot:ETO07977.1 hypothetical protein RFI_29411 [Reticulomyxa filosa]